MPPPFRIAILECDTPLAGTRSRYGSYGGVFTSLLHCAADTLSIPRRDIEISTWDVVHKMEYPAAAASSSSPSSSLEDIDAVLMTGSKYNSFDNDPWIVKLVEFTQRMLAQDRVRIVGVCFGHQIVGRALGAKVARSDRGWEASVCQVQLSERGKELFGKELLNIHQMHKDIVYNYPSGVEHLGSSPTCQVQGMYIPQKLMTVQGHPEFDAEIVTELLRARHKQQIFSDETFEDAMARVAREQDGVLVAGAFLRFLREGRGDEMG